MRLDQLFRRKVNVYETSPAVFHVVSLEVDSGWLRFTKHLNLVSRTMQEAGDSFKSSIVWARKIPKDSRRIQETCFNTVETAKLEVHPATCLSSNARQWGVLTQLEHHRPFVPLCKLQAEHWPGPTGFNWVKTIIIHLKLVLNHHNPS